MKDEVEFEQSKSIGVLRIQSRSSVTREERGISHKTGWSEVRIHPANTRYQISIHKISTSDG